MSVSEMSKQDTVPAQDEVPEVVGVKPKTRKATDGESKDTLIDWDIDMSLDLSERPMTGKDVENFRARHGIQTSDAIYALCIQNSAKFNEVCRYKSLPFTLELLIRLYDVSPGPASWEQVDPQYAYGRLYGEIERDFAGSSLAKDVRLALYHRFTAALGRSVYTAYRWVEGQGNAKANIVKIFAKLLAMPNPRETLEQIATLMYKTRRLDLDVMVPLPTLANPPVPRRRGPQKGSKKAPPTPEQALAAAERREQAKQDRLADKRAATAARREAAKVASAAKAAARAQAKAEAKAAAADARAKAKAEKAEAAAAAKKAAADGSVSKAPRKTAKVKKSVKAVTTARVVKGAAKKAPAKKKTAARVVTSPVAKKAPAKKGAAKKASKTSRKVVSRT